MQVWKSGKDRKGYKDCDKCGAFLIFKMEDLCWTKYWWNPFKLVDGKYRIICPECGKEQSALGTYWERI
jgi:ssDNA-binding Zn-finger/Zn-ribbon topoisomerase 1